MAWKGSIQSKECVKVKLDFEWWGMQVQMLLNLGVAAGFSTWRCEFLTFLNISCWRIQLNMLKFYYMANPLLTLNENNKWAWKSGSFRLLLDVTKMLLSGCGLDESGKLFAHPGWTSTNYDGKLYANIN